MNEPIKKSLIQIINEKDDMLAEIAASDGEVSEWVGELLSKNKEEEKVKVENYAIVMNEFRLQADYLEEMGKLITKRAKSYHGLIKRLKDHLSYVMRHDNRMKLEGLTTQYTLKRNKGTLLVNPDANLEAMFMAGSPYIKETKVYSVDNECCRAAIERGEILDFVKIEDGFTLQQSEIKRVELPKETT